MSASIAAPWARSAGQPGKSKQSHFLRMQKIPKQKEKAPAGKFICQAGACFSQGLRNGDQKKTKKWYTRRDSNPRPSTPEADALSS